MKKSHHKKCRIGLIGAGRIGQLHAENICYRLPQFQLAGIADPRLDHEWAETLPCTVNTMTSDELIAHPDIDAILIASPSHLHIQQIIAASHAKKAIFCEKPIGLNEEEIKQAIQVTEQNNTLLQLGFNRRFDPNFATMQQCVSNGDIGNPHILRITSRDPGCPSKEYCQTSGGIFMDMTIHDFDMARYLVGSEVVSVFATGAVLINPEFKELGDVDTATIQLHFANGALGVIDNSRQAVYGYDQRAEVFGEKGMLTAANEMPHSVTHHTGDNTRYSNPHYFFLERYQEAYLAELRVFYHAWAEQKTSPVTAFDGLQAFRIAEAAMQSLKTQKPVALTSTGH